MACPEAVEALRRGPAGTALKKKRHPLAKVKGGWTAEEDAELTRLVMELGEGNWSPIARALNAATGKDEANGRIGKQCRERWNHHLRPDIRKDAWTREEEAMLVKAHKELGNRWSDIAKTIPGRSENSVKNHWNATLRRRDLPDPDPGPLKVYMQTLNLIGPQTRRSPAGGGGQSSKGRKPAKRRASSRFTESDDSTSSGESEDDEVEGEEDGERGCWQPRRSDGSSCGAAVPAGASASYRAGSSACYVSASNAAAAATAGRISEDGSRPKRARTAAGARLRDLVAMERDNSEGGSDAAASETKAVGPAEQQVVVAAALMGGASGACSYGGSGDASGDSHAQAATWAWSGASSPHMAAAAAAAAAAGGRAPHAAAASLAPFNAAAASGVLPKSSPFTTYPAPSPTSVTSQQHRTGQAGGWPPAAASLPSMHHAYQYQCQQQQRAMGYATGGSTAAQMPAEGRVSWTGNGPMVLPAAATTSASMQQHSTNTTAAPADAWWAAAGQQQQQGHLAAAQHQHNQCSADVAAVCVPAGWEPNPAATAATGTDLRNMAISPATAALEHTNIMGPGQGCDPLELNEHLDLGEDGELLDLLSHFNSNHAGAAPPPSSHHGHHHHHQQQPQHNNNNNNNNAAAAGAARAHSQATTVSAAAAAAAAAPTAQPSMQPSWEQWPAAAAGDAVATAAQQPAAAAAAGGSYYWGAGHPSQAAAAAGGTTGVFSRSASNSSLQSQGGGGSGSALRGGSTAPPGAGYGLLEPSGCPAPLHSGSSSGMLPPAAALAARSSSGGVEHTTVAQASTGLVGCTDDGLRCLLKQEAACGTIMVTTSVLPNMDKLLQEHMCLLASDQGGAAADATSDGGSGAPPFQLGSQGPVRVCLPALHDHLTRIAASGSSPSTVQLATTYQVVQGMARALQHLCSGVQARTPGLRGYFLAVRLGSDTAADEYSVLLGLKGDDMQAVGAAVDAISAGVTPLLC